MQAPTPLHAQALRHGGPQIYVTQPELSLSWCILIPLTHGVFLPTQETAVLGGSSRTYGLLKPRCSPTRAGHFGGAVSGLPLRQKTPTDPEVKAPQPARPPPHAARPRRAASLRAAGPAPLRGDD